MNNEWHSKEELNKGENSWICRFKLNEAGDNFEVINKATESILIKNEAILFMLEYAQDKLFVTVFKRCIFLIDNWASIKCI